MYDNKASNITVGQQLPPNCSSTTAGCPGTSGATNDGTYPGVFNNDIYDGNFGLTSAIYLDEVTPFGQFVHSVPVPNSNTGAADQLVTSFSSKSELGLHLSLSGQYLTFMGYVAPVDAVDISNSNTPLAVDPTNPVGENAYRAAAAVDAAGNFHFLETNAYSGNNGREVILNDVAGNVVAYTAGNAGNGANPQPNGVILGAGAQLLEGLIAPEAAQQPALPTPVASFSVTELGSKADKVGKDDNFRGMTIYNNVLYFTKGSGGNGVNTLYFVDTTGTACPNGVGVPVAGAPRPTNPLSYNASTLQSSGLPSNMCVLSGFPTVLAKNDTTGETPFDVWFASPTVLYLADEGDAYTGGADLYTHAAAQTLAGLQKWVFNSSTKSWSRVYTLQAGLDLGQPYTVPGYPTGNNPATGLPWAPATDGLRHITGEVVDGLVLIYGTTSTVSGNGDIGADPNRVVAMFDLLDNTDPNVAQYEIGLPIRQAGFAEVLRGIALTPGTPVTGSY